MPTANEEVAISVVLKTNAFVQGAAVLGKGFATILTWIGKLQIGFAKLIVKVVTFTALLGPRFVALLGRAATGLARLVSSLVTFRGLLILFAVQRFTQVFLDLETGLTKVLTLVRESSLSFLELQDTIVALSLVSGQSFATLTNALFEIVSAGNSIADAVEVLSVANRLAVAGNTTVDAAAKGILALMNAYSLSAENALAISDALFAAQKVGITTIQRLANNIGKVAPIARLAGVGLQELLSAVAAVTKVGISTEQTTTAVRALLNSIIQPSKEAADAARLMGIEFSVAGLKGKGLSQFLSDLIKASGGELTVISKLIPELRGLLGFASLSIDGMLNLTKALDEQALAVGSTQSAYELFLNNLEFNFDILKAKFNAFSVEVTKILKDIFLGSAENLGSLFDEMRFALIRNGPFISAILKTIGDRFTQLFNIIKELDKQDLFLKAFRSVGFGVLTFIGDVFLGIGSLFITVGRIIGQSIFFGIFDEADKALRSLSKTSIGRGILKVLGFDVDAITGFEEFLTFIGEADESFRSLETSLEMAVAQKAELDKALSTNSLDPQYGRDLNASINLATIAMQKHKDELFDLKNELKGRNLLTPDLSDDISQLQFYIDTFQELIKEKNVPEEEIAQFFGLTKEALDTLKLRLIELTLQEEKAFGTIEDLRAKALQAQLKSGLEGTRKIAYDSIVNFNKTVAKEAGPEVTEIWERFWKDTFSGNLFSAALAGLPQDEAQNIVAELILQFGVFDPNDPAVAQAAAKRSIALKEFFQKQAIADEAARQSAVQKAIPEPVVPKSLFDPFNTQAASALDLFKEQSGEFVRLINELRAKFDAGLINADKFEEDFKNLIEGLQQVTNDSILLGTDAIDGYSEALKAYQDQLRAEGKPESLIPGGEANLKFIIVQVQELRKAIIEVAEAINTLDSPGILDSLTFGMRQASEQFATFGDIAREAGSTLVSTFANDFTNALVEGGASFQEFAADFIKTMLKMILRGLILNSIFRALGGTPAQPNLNFSGFGNLGFNKGGEVPGAGPDRDSVTAKLTPEEWVINRSSSRYYGRKFMDLINRKAIPRELFEALLGGKAPAAIGRVKFSSGGEVSNSPSMAGNRQGYILSDRQQFDRLVAGGGRESMMSMFKSSPEMFRAALGINQV